MITAIQLTKFVKRFKTNETSVYREYLQIMMLKAIYDEPMGKTIYFKGGTAIHLLFGSPRFSEDLDFTVSGSESTFLEIFERAVKRIGALEDIAIKKRATIAGNRWLLTAHPSILRFPIYLTLDFSFRERVLDPQQSTLTSVFPIVFTSYVHHVSMEEILAEKVRAILTRRKGRDLYDLWYLSTRGAMLNTSIVEKKISYYKLSGVTPAQIYDRIASFTQDAFVEDLRPFVPIPERAKLPQFFSYLKAYLKQTLT